VDLPLPELHHQVSSPLSPSVTCGSSSLLSLRILTEFQQSHKLAMYQKLYTTIAVFAILFVLVSFLMSLSAPSSLPCPSLD
jgi:hypothetical protein